MPRGDNFRKGCPDGEIGRCLGGKKRTRLYNSQPFEDDSKRTNAQFWAQYGWWSLIEKYGRKRAGEIMAQRGVQSFRREREEYTPYLGEMRALGNGDILTNSWDQSGESSKEYPPGSELPY